MPELPDVEGFRRVLEHAAGRRIGEVDVRDPGVLREVTPRRLAQALIDHCLGTPRRHGKWLVAPVREPKARHRRDEPSLVFHFGMTGELVWSDGEPRHRHDRVVIVTEGGELRYRDMRKLQGLRLGAAGRVPDRASWLTGRRDDQDGVCPRCGARLRHGRIAGRHTVWCPRCQPS